MKIAIPEFKGRVAPTFDFCRHLLVADFSARKPSEMIRVDFSGIKGRDRAAFLKDRGINLLLCGTISQDLAEEIEKSGIKIVPVPSGEIGEVLEAYAMDRLRELNLELSGIHGENAKTHPDQGRNGAGKSGRRHWSPFTKLGRSVREKTKGGS